VPRLPFVLLACATLSSACRGREEPPRAQNVLLIVVDTLRADRLGCYGYPRPTSPAIDALAARGVVYEDCHSQSCWTVPSMISMMSGLPVTRTETALPARPALAEVLRGHGFATAAFLANPTLGVGSNFARGFDHFGTPYMRRAREVALAFERWYGTWRAERVAGTGAARGFFAWVHFIDPHHPYLPEAEFDVFEGPRPDRDLLLPRWKAAQARAAAMAGERADSLSFGEAVREMEAASNRYDGEVLAVDAGVARVVELLRASGELERTLIVLCSDHGEMLYEHESYPYLIQRQVEIHGGLPGGVMDLFGAGHRPWYYEELWNTPLVLAGPGMPAGERRGGLAANLDIVPTVLEALDLPRPEGLAGQSLWGGAEPRRESVFAFGHKTTAVLDLDRRKLVVPWAHLMLLPDDAEDPSLLFDLEEDPLELRELASERPATARELRRRIDAWRTRNQREVIDAVSAEQLRALQQMGYVDGIEPVRAAER